MPIAELPTGRPNPTGAIAFGDITAILGRQVQPSFAWSDMVAGTSPDYVRRGESLMMNRTAGVAHAPMIHVPHHQTMTGTTVIDGGAYLAARPGLPSQLWEVVTSGDEPSSGTSNLSFIAKPDNFYQSEVLSYALISAYVVAGAPYIATVDALQVHVKTDTTFLDLETDPEATPIELDDQGFFLQFSNYVLGGAGEGMPAEIEVWWYIHAPGDDPTEGVRCRLILSQKLPPKFYFGSTLMRDVTNNVSPLGTRGNFSLSNTAESPFVQVVSVGGKLVVTCKGLSEPIVVHLDRLFRADITENIGGDNWEYEGYAHFPANGSISHWRGGGNMSSDPGWRGDYGSGTLTDSSPTDSYIEVASVDLEGRTVYIPEPRIGEVHVIFRRITHASWQLWPLRWESAWSYDSIQQQLGFTPDLGETPWSYTTHTAGDWRETLSGVAWEHGLYLGSEITVTDGADIIGSEIHQYNLVATMPVMSTYNGDNYSRWTTAVQRVDCRIDGIHDYVAPDETTVTLTNLGVSPTPANRLVNAVINTQTFDINSLQVTNMLDIQLDNFYGRTVDLAGKLGITGIGNIGVMFRCGYEHQDDDAYKGDPWYDPLEPGFSRYVGYCDTFSYQGRKVHLSCPDDFSRVRSYTLMVPPLLDGWNHYRAVYTLLQMAGVPDDRIGFMAMVPPNPHEYMVGDPDEATGGYFLPLGIGANPWTPIYANIKVGELLGMIQQLTGYVMYCDSYGVYQYEPFLRSTPVGVPKRVFRVREVMDSNLGFPQYASASVTFTTRDVRNKVALLGLDAFGNGNLDPIVAKFEDTASIDSPVGSQPINYCGFIQPFAWMDSRFASFPFALASAERLYKILRQPGIEVSIVCTAGQPDVFVMDWIVLEEWRSGLTGPAATAEDLPLFVTNVQLEYKATEKGPMLETRITARYIDPSLAEDVDGVLG